MSLLIYGARQVGKTYTVLAFGKKHYRNTAYFNPEDFSEVAVAFQSDLDPHRIVRKLATKSGQSI